jgi:hypothetical protein
MGHYYASVNGAFPWETAHMTQGREKLSPIGKDGQHGSHQTPGVNPGSREG